MEFFHYVSAALKRVNDASALSAVAGGQIALKFFRILAHVVKKPCQISRVGESCGIETLRRALRAAGDVALHALSDNFTVISLAHMSIIGHETPPFVCILYLLYKLYHT